MSKQKQSILEKFKEKNGYDVIIAISRDERGYYIDRCGVLRDRYALIGLLDAMKISLLNEPIKAGEPE